MTKESTISLDCKVSSRIIGGESLSALRALLQEEQEIFVFFDAQAAWVAEAVCSAAGASVRASVGLETSEEGKTMETVLALERQLLEAGASRNALLLAVGGGITTDITGFVASIYKRGIRYANIPTTLLAQVDAAIGGKTGVNLDGYKNMLGAFRQPEFTFLCPEPLKTLPARELRAGIAELLKTFLIGDAAAYNAALAAFAGTKTPDSVPEGAKNGDSGTRMPDSVPGDWIMKAAGIKAEIVQRDPFEGGERAVLNLGHTFGHAIEHEALERGDDMLHGEAVAIGIILAARLSEALGIAQEGLAERLKADFASIGLLVESPYPLESLRDAMEKDKKAGGGKVRFVLPIEPGQVTLVPLSPADACEKLSRV